VAENKTEFVAAALPYNRLAIPAMGKPLYFNGGVYPLAIATTDREVAPNPTPQRVQTSTRRSTLEE
jgi:hypothetical protein